ncbi:PTS lactose/cellobiose transporter subunit IIA [Priestia filamentosa]|uniref:PTS lactose/cellobiose transporter subunit IIA n=1 Tax=Priestia filamentosa TaxID=1402861 RepID=UPI00058929C1
MNIEEICFQLILNGGDAKSHAMEAIFHAKEGDFAEAEKSLAAASNSIREAHHQQTALIQGEARGEKTEIRILLIHAQDHLMNAITINDMAKEIVDIHKKLQ